MKDPRPTLLAVMSTIVLVVPPALLGCQTPGASTPRVSLAEAKQITANLQQPSLFTPPPRTVADVLAMLHAPDAQKTEVFEQLKAKAEAPIPASARESPGAPFYLERAQAKRLLGRYDEALPDAQQAVEQGDRRQRLFAFQTLAVMYEELGDFQAAVVAAKRATGLAELSGQVILSHLALATMYANIGAFSAANAALARARAHVPDTYNWGTFAEWAPVQRNAVTMVEGQLLSRQGRYAVAETKLQATIQAVESDIKHGARHESYRDPWGFTLAAARAFTGLCPPSAGRNVDARRPLGRSRTCGA